MTEDVVLLDRSRPELALVTLNRPDRLNAISPEVVDALHRTLDELAADEACRVVILTGAGRGFCAGLDLAAPRASSGPAGVPTLFRWQERFAGMVRKLHRLPQPVIAAVNGPAAGGGFALAAGADVRVAASTAKFHVAAIRIGLSAGESGLTYLLPRLIGASRAFELMVTGRPIDAEEAERIGLVSRVVADDEVVKAAIEIAEQILSNSPFGVRQTKQIMWRNLDAADLEAATDLENRTQILAVQTGDFREATTAFVEKRPPRFTGD